MDGRVARGLRVREAIVRAMLDLFEEGNLRPTMAEIARRARVSLRALFNHFKDNEALISEAFRHQEEREHSRPAIKVDPDRPLDEKIEAYAEQQSAFLEAVTPYRRSAIASEPFSREVSEGLSRARDRTRRRLEEVFAPELAPLETADRRKLVAMLMVASSWPSWETLRASLQLTALQARDTMKALLRCILLAPSAAKKRGA